MDRYNALVIDDEIENLDLIKTLLNESFNVHGAGDGEEGFNLALKLIPDVILLDIGLPKIDGLKVCDKLRNHEATRHVPIIMLTASKDSESIVKAFNNGADDYISKPYRGTELVSRVLSKVRRLSETRPSKNSEIVCGNLKIAVERMSIIIDARPVTLSLLEFTLLKYLVENRDKVLSREKILQAVWKEEKVSDRTVDTHMVSLRKNLKGFDHVIDTVYGAGYILKKS